MTKGRTRNATLHRIRIESYDFKRFFMVFEDGRAHNTVWTHFQYTTRADRSGFYEHLNESHHRK